MEILQSLFYFMYTNIILKSPQTHVVTRSLMECSITCVATPECYSFYYDDADGSCFVVDGYVHPGGPSTEARVGVVYYSKPSPQMLCKFLLNYRLNPIGLCYKIHEDPLEFYPAREACQAEGADLASVKTTVIENFYKSTLSVDWSDVFFGATDAGTPGMWRWMDGTPWPSFTTSASKHCLEYFYTAGGGRFDVDDCSGTSQKFACEIALPNLYY